MPPYQTFAKTIDDSIPQSNCSQNMENENANDSQTPFNFPARRPSVVVEDGDVVVTCALLCHVIMIIHNITFYSERHRASSLSFTPLTFFRHRRTSSAPIRQCDIECFVAGFSTCWVCLTHTNAQMHVCIARYNFRYTCSSLAGGRVFSVSRDERRISSAEWCFKLRSNREYGEHIRCATLFLVRRKYIHRVVGILSRIHMLYESQWWIKRVRVIAFVDG